MVTLKPSVLRLTLGSIIMSVIIFSILSLGLYLLTQVLNFSSTLLSLGLLLLFLFFFLPQIFTVLRLKRTSYNIKKELFSSKVDFLSEYKTDIPTTQITNVTYSIGFFLDRIFKTGSIQVFTSGSSSSDMSLRGIKNVESVYESINDYLNLTKSEKISSSGEFLSNKAQENLIRRVKPNVALATISSVFSVLFIALIFGLQGLLGFIFLLQNIVYLLLVVLGFILFLGGYIYFTYKRYKRIYYDFYTTKLEYYDGFFTLNKVTIPLERITNIDSTQGLFDRILGVYTILVETAGSSGSEVKIAFVTDGETIVSHLKEVLKKHGRN